MDTILKDDKVYSIELNKVPISWNLSEGSLSFFGLSSTLFWNDPSLLKMLQPLAKEVGYDMFRLMVAYSSSHGTDEDYYAMINTLENNFVEGFLAWGNAVSTAGWGHFEVLEFDYERKIAKVLIKNPWELNMQHSLEKEAEQWGCPFLQGKIIGIFSHAMGVNCWADEKQIVLENNGLAVEFYVYQSEKTIVEELEKLRWQKMRDKEKVLAHEVEKKTSELLEAQKAYSRFVPREFLKFLNKESVVDIQLGDQVEKEMTILFSDIRGFTSLSEKMTPQDNFDFINAYLGQMEPVILQHKGIIDKYIGDAIMALFPTNADDALKGAIAMLKALAKYNQILQYTEFKKMHIGIGLHTGKLMLGTIGGQSRMDSTVISDAVNLASRIEALTKTYHTPLLITEDTYQQLIDPSQYQIRVIDRVTVKGKIEPVTIYEVFDTQEPTQVELKSTTLADFEQGFQDFHNEQFESAQKAFEKVLQVNDNDKGAQIYIENCQKVLGLLMPKQPIILIVDDMPANLKVLFNILKKQFEVLIAEDGETCLEAVFCKNPHLILLDIMMPEMDGFEVCQRLKENPKTQDIPVIFITALFATEDKIKGFQLGAVDYITKPFQAEEVLSRIKTHLKLSHLQRQIQMRNVELETQNLQLKEKINTLAMQTTCNI
ncbi:adenylate/guanylate cyclase domain-containing protein [Candidatus Parabeggiatoa sp. HSG14]|uniref:response regulator n=1 Tax=Candidatus Parabeggiatoa sp. HSG14 TaxID=3055593 RepID=UPI0025A7269B|nr:adenylate/guanylate cyclase domain-containing protein [Thiotrichales bacterium HSG14]